MHLSLSPRTDAYICGRARARQKCEHVHKYSHIEPAVAWPLFIVALISISMKAGIPCTENRRRIAVLLYLNARPSGRSRECRKYSISSSQKSKGPFFASGARSRRNAVVLFGETKMRRLSVTRIFIRL